MKYPGWGVKAFPPVAADTFILSLPSPRILQSPLVTSRMTGEAAVIANPGLSG